MIYRRKIYEKLLRWKREASREKALLIEGARRVGKTTIVREFARKEYKSCLFIDFNDAPPSALRAFEQHRNDPDVLFMLLSAEFGVRLFPGESLVVFDEIQRFPLARQAVKNLVADGRFSYIETGSLVSIRENVKDITLPSEERALQMYPMDFEEFCWAAGEGPLTEYIRRCFERREPLEEGLHRKAMLLFRQHLLVGGMPRCVEKFLDGRDFEAADREKRDILSLYRNDISKAAKSYRNKVLSIFEQIPSFLSHHEKRIRMSSLSPGAAYPLYEDTFFWLAESMITNECYNCADPGVGLSMNEERTLIKCYMGDTGLLFSHAFQENEIADQELYKAILFGRLSVNNGMLFENAVAQNLAAAGHRLFFYTRYNPEKRRNDIEIDFLLSNRSKTRYRVDPVEVKSGKVCRAASLAAFMEKFKGRIGQPYIIHPRNLSVRDGIVRLPAYMAGCL